MFTFNETFFHIFAPELKDKIGEFRTLFRGTQHKMPAFWDKTDSKNTLVISTHGFVKKRNKVPDSEIIMPAT